jgi:DNA-binding response OmpR family regulator
MTAVSRVTSPILVVDDDEKIVRLVRTYLERDGFDVVTATDGRAALAAIERHQPASSCLISCSRSSTGGR